MEQDEDNPEIQRLEKNYLVRGPSTPSIHHEDKPKLGWLLVGLGGLVMGGLVVVSLQLAWQEVRRRRDLGQRTWNSPAGEGYVPMAVIEEAVDDEALLSPEEREGPQ